MKQPATIPTTFTFQNHKIRTVKRDGSVCFVSSDICQALGIANAREALDYLTPKKMNVLEGQDISEPSEFLYFDGINHINQTYGDLFPDTPSTTSPEVYTRLEGL